MDEVNQVTAGPCRSAPSRGIPTVLLDQVENYFLQLRDELEAEDMINVRLGWNGYIVVRF